MKSNTIEIDKSDVPHHSVLLKEVIDNLSIKKDGKYLDCTFGAGGYTKAILNYSDCFVSAIDRDPSVIQYANDILIDYKDKFNFIPMNFADISEKLKDIKYDGIVLDLGISSMQVDQAQRGFSFMKDGPLDMRMSSEGISAGEWLSSASEQEIADIIYKYGDEVQSRAIAKAIVNYRAESVIDTTSKLALIVRGAKHYRAEKIDPATKTFQAIRIYINKELESLEKFLANVENSLKCGGRLVVVSFHSLEDSIVKNFFKESSARKVARSKYAKEQDKYSVGKWLKIITKKPIMPSISEIKENPRSRSAKLRVAEKSGGHHVI